MNCFEGYGGVSREREGAADNGKPDATKIKYCLVLLFDLREFTFPFPRHYALDTLNT